MPETDRDRKRRIKYQLFIQLGGACKDCGAKDLPLCCYDFHHRDPFTKVFDIADGLSRASLKRLQVEVEKCDLICANCHRIRTHIGFRTAKDFVSERKKAIAQEKRMRQQTNNFVKAVLKREV
jgi:hypothetical protein